MTKAEFLEKLRIELSSGVTPQVLQENLNYYSQYIDDEIRKGRTESEVLAELGDPWILAKTIVDAPNSTRIGRANKKPMAIKTKAQIQTMEKEVFMIFLASCGSFFPRSIENNGAPPLPNRLLNAVIITITGKQRPTAPSAAVPTFGIRAI